MKHKNSYNVYLDKETIKMLEEINSGLLKLNLSALCREAIKRTYNDLKNKSSEKENV